MLRTLRLLAAILFFSLLTLLFLDFSGTVHAWFGWMAKTQFLPALLAWNAGVVVFLLLLTLALGRVYCSVVCPLGVLQDAISWIAGKRKKNRFRYSPALPLVRYGMLALFVVALAAGVGSLVALLAPYSAYGRIASNLFAPLWQWGNNGLAYLAERADRYTFYSVDVWIKGLSTFLAAVATFGVVGWLAWRNGRTYCNTVCPVGTVLGFFARYAWFKPVIDPSKCVDCQLCARNCKASCIQVETHRIDYSRCVACMDCVDKCRKGAIRYTHRPDLLKGQGMGMDENVRKKVTENTRKKVIESARKKENVSTATPGKTIAPEGRLQAAVKAIPSSLAPARRRFLTTAAFLTAAAGSKAAAAGLRAVASGFKATASNLNAAASIHPQAKKVDGGLAVLVDKQIPNRSTPLTPPGSSGARQMLQHCTACQLCVSACPNQVLRPSADWTTWMQPEMSYERGYCRPECVRCAEVCPTGAIRPLTVADKSAIQIGHAVWVKKYCIPLTDGRECDNCARHCPTGAIQMVPWKGEAENAPQGKEAAQGSGTNAPQDGGAGVGRNTEEVQQGMERPLRIPVVDIERCIGCGACENLCPARPLSAIYVEGHEAHRLI